MHGWGHAQDKGVTRLNLGNVPESQTDSSGFPTFGAEDGVGATGSRRMVQVVVFCAGWRGKWVRLVIRDMIAPGSGWDRPGGLSYF